MNSTSLYRKFTGTAGVMLINRALVMLSAIIFARYLGPEQYGLFTFSLSIITIGTLPVIAGMPNLIVREVSQLQFEEKWGLLRGLINWSKAYVVVTSIFILGTIYVLLYTDSLDKSVSQLLWLAVLLIPVKGLLTQQGAIFNGLRKPILAQLPVNVFMPIITLVAFCVCVLFQKEIDSLTLINITLLSSIVACIISAFLLRLVFKSSVKKKPPEYDIKKWHISILPFSMMTLVGTLNTELASIFLGGLIDDKTVAFFKIAMTAVNLVAVGLGAINVIMMPNIARLYKSNSIKEAQNLLTRGVRLGACFSLPIILALVIFGDFAIELFFGHEYIKAYPALVVLCIGQTANVLMGSVALVLNMTGNEKSTLKSLSLTLVVNILLFIFLIPNYSLIGAATAVSIGLIFWNILMAIDVWRYTKLKPWLR